MPGGLGIELQFDSRLPWRINFHHGIQSYDRLGNNLTIGQIFPKTVMLLPTSLQIQVQVTDPFAFAVAGQK